MTKKPLTSEELTQLTSGLNKLARNLWWTWDQEAQEYFRNFRRAAGRISITMPSPMLHEVSDYELRVRLQDPDFAERVREVLKRFRRVHERTSRRGGSRTRRRLRGQSGGIFFGGVRFSRNVADCGGRAWESWRATMPNPRATSGLGFAGISLFYREGYFQQAIDHEQLADGILHAAESQRICRSNRC